MSSIILSIHVIIAVLLIGLILVQHGKGADAGAAFGSGASSTVFGSQGSASFLTRLTGGLAAAFFITSLVLAYNTKSNVSGKDDVDIPTPVQQIKDQAIPEAPAVDTGDKPTLPMSLNEDMPSKADVTKQDKSAVPAAKQDMPAIPAKSDISE